MYICRPRRTSARTGSCRTISWGTRPPSLPSPAPHRLVYATPTLTWNTPPYVLYGVKYVDLVSLTPSLPPMALHRLVYAYVLCGVEYVEQSIPYTFLALSDAPRTLVYFTLPRNLRESGLYGVKHIDLVSLTPPLPSPTPHSVKYIDLVSLTFSFPSAAPHRRGPILSGSSRPSSTPGTAATLPGSRRTCQRSGQRLRSVLT